MCNMIQIYSSKINDLYEKTITAIIDEIKKIEKETFIAIQEERDVLEMLNFLLDKADEIPKEKWDLLKFCQTNTKKSTQIKELFYNYLIAKGKIKQSQIIVYDETEKNALIAYNVKVRKVDIAILSAGFDCSIAGIYKNSEQVNDLSNEFIQIINTKTNQKEITLTRTTLKNATCFTLFISETKRDAFNKYQNDKLNENECPLKLFNKSKKLYLITNLK
jgi:6-phosphogluconolactonase/glucosamine-6-phosphate isomerase/deaminase